MCLPTTFHEHAGSSQPETWQSARGTVSRIDYPALSLRHKPCVKHAGVLHQVDLALRRQDHWCVVAFISAPVEAVQTLPVHRKRNFDIKQLSDPHKVNAFVQDVASLSVPH